MRGTEWWTRTVLLAGASLLVGGVAQAQADAPADDGVATQLSLGKIVVSAGAEKVAIDTPQAVTALDQDDIDQTQATTIGDLLEGVPGVSAVGGVHDLVTEIRLGSMPALHHLLAQIRALPGVADINTLIYSTVIKGFFVSEYRGGVRIDAIDAALIEQLQRDGRTSFRALGEAVRLSPSAVATRVDRLISGGVIKISAVEARGLAQRQLSLGVGLNLAGHDDAVIGALRAWRGIDFAARTLGRFDLIMTLVEPSAGALYASLERIRALPGVSHTESWFHLAVLKEDYARTLRAAEVIRAGR